MFSGWLVMCGPTPHTSSHKLATNADAANITGKCAALLGV